MARQFRYFENKAHAAAFIRDHIEAIYQYLTEIREAIEEVDLEKAEKSEASWLALVDAALLNKRESPAAPSYNAAALIRELEEEAKREGQTWPPKE